MTDNYHHDLFPNGTFYAHPQLCLAADLTVIRGRLERAAHCSRSGFV